MALTSLAVMRSAPVIPVMVLTDVAQSVQAARALVAGGVRMLEVTLRTPVALDCMRAIAREVPGAVVGAGTVRNARDVTAALEAGAAFAVSPGYTQGIGRACLDQGMPLLPGVASASDICQALSDGFDCLKFFPAVQAGGIQMLRAWHGPFADVRFCPTGGITAATAPDFLALPNVVCVGGSWLVPADALAQGDWRRIEALARESLRLGATAPPLS